MDGTGNVWMDHTMQALNGTLTITPEVTSIIDKVELLETHQLFQFLGAAGIKASETEYSDPEPEIEDFFASYGGRDGFRAEFGEPSSEVSGLAEEAVKLPPEYHLELLARLTAVVLNHAGLVDIFNKKT